MKAILFCSAFLLAGVSVVSAQPAFAKAAAQRQLFQAQMNQMAWGSNSGGNPAVRGQAAYVTVYAKDSVVSGIGMIFHDEGGLLRGPEYSWLEMEGRRYLPSFTDSVKAMDPKGVERTGYPSGYFWDFVAETGRLSAYSKSPGGEISKVVFSDGKPYDVGKYSDLAAITKELRNVHVASLFQDSSLGYSIRLYNRLFESDTAWKRYQGSWQLEGLFRRDTLVSWDISEYKPRDPGDFVEMTVAAKVACVEKNFVKADSLFARLDKMVPDMFSTYRARGLCAMVRGDKPDALRQYQLAYKYAPGGQDLLDGLRDRIWRIQKTMEPAK